MNYEETLNKVESFMVSSGIRDFCTETCQGYCCDKCYTSKNACHKNEGRRLSCSVFICLNLRDIIFSRKENEAYMEVKKMIEHKFTEFGISFGSIYFYPHSKRVRDKFLIEDGSLDLLNEINISEVKNKLRAIKNINVTLSRFLVDKLRSKHVQYGINRRK